METFFFNLKNSARIAQGKQQLKFERNPRIRYSDNCDMGGRTTNGQATDEFRFHEFDLLNNEAELIK